MVQATAAEITDLVMRYYQINIARRPEFMGKTTFNYVNYGDEGQKRLDDLTALLTRATAVSDSLPANKKDALYEMVLYPIRASKLQNEKYIAAGKADLYAGQGRTASVTKYRNMSTTAYNTIRSDLTYYNNTLAGGKWQKMMDPYNAGDGQPVIEGMPSLAAVPAASGTLGVAVEGQTTGNEATTLKFSVYNDDRRFIDVFTKGAAGFCVDGHHLAALDQADEDVWHRSPTRTACGPASTGRPPPRETAPERSPSPRAPRPKTISVAASNPATPTRNDLDGYVESNGYVAIEAENFTQKIDRGGAEWRVFKQLGRNGDSVKALPDVSASITSNLPTTSPELDYKIYFFTHRDVPGHRLSHSHLEHDGSLSGGHRPGQRRPADPHRRALRRDAKWSNNVLEHIEKLSGTIQVSTPGYHTFKLWKVDPSSPLTESSSTRADCCRPTWAARELSPLRLGRFGPPGGRSWGTYDLRLRHCGGIQGGSLVAVSIRRLS